MRFLDGALIGKLSVFLSSFCAASALLKFFLDEAEGLYIVAARWPFRKAWAAADIARPNSGGVTIPSKSQNV